MAVADAETMGTIVTIVRSDSVAIPWRQG